MSANKKHPTVAACGLDCVLCPRYYTVGKSRCGGCGSEYSPASIGCKIFRCCVKEKGLGTCAECKDHPCPMLDGVDAADSFVTHRRMLTNLRSIKDSGIESFLEEQAERHGLLERMLGEHDDGRSRSFFCVAATLLPIEALADSIEAAMTKVNEAKLEDEDRKGRAGILRAELKEAAGRAGLDLELRKTNRKKKP